MAQRKSEADVLRNEKYMDDAVFSAFKNLHKAAKKKSEYVWATEKFSSLDSIWGDPIEPENSKVLDVASNVSKNPKHEPKPLKRQYCNIGTKLNTSQLSRSNQTDLKLRPVDVRQTGLFSEQNQRSFTTRKLSLLDNFDNDYEKRNSCSRNESGNSNQASKAEAPNIETLKLKYYNELVNTYKSYEDTVKREVHKINADINANYEGSSEDFQKKQNFHGISPVKIEDQSRHSVEEVEETSRLAILENCVVKTTPKVEENDSMKSHKSENEFQSYCPKSKISSYRIPRKEKTEEPKRKRLYLSSSVNSIPDPKHSPVENQNRDITYGADKRSDMLRTILVLKIFKGEIFFDFVIELSDFKRMKKRFPKLKEVFPEIDGGEKELCYSADAVKIVFG